MKHLAPVFTAALLCGCAASPPATSSHNHPADPGMAESPMPMMSDRMPTTNPSTMASMYICPMHPEVTSSTPGTCPKCGMKLRPKMVQK